MNLILEIPIRASTSQNARLHWRELAKIRASEKRAVAYRFNPKTVRPVLLIKLTRVAPREMDGDNLQSAMKGIRDGVAARLRIDDRSPLVQWLYAQEKRGVGEYAVRVEIVTPLALNFMGTPEVA